MLLLLQMRLQGLVFMFSRFSADESRAAAARSTRRTAGKSNERVGNCVSRSLFFLFFQHLRQHVRCVRQNTDHAPIEIGLTPFLADGLPPLQNATLSAKLNAICNILQHLYHLP